MERGYSVCDLTARGSLEPIPWRDETRREGGGEKEERSRRWISPGTRRVRWNREPRTCETRNLRSHEPVEPGTCGTRNLWNLNGVILDLKSSQGEETH